VQKTSRRPAPRSRTIVVTCECHTWRRQLGHHGAADGMANRNETAPSGSAFQREIARTAASSWSWPRSFSTFSSRPGVGVVIRATLSPRPEIVCATVSARIGACRVHVQGGPGAGGGGTFVHTFPVRIVGFCGGGGVFELAFANSDLHGRG
jgi:hypothetical protein